MRFTGALWFSAAAFALQGEFASAENVKRTGCPKGTAFIYGYGNRDPLCVGPVAIGGVVALAGGAIASSIVSSIYSNPCAQTEGKSKRDDNSHYASTRIGTIVDELVNNGVQDYEIIENGTGIKFNRPMSDEYYEANAASPNVFRYFPERECKSGKHTKGEIKTSWDDLLNLTLNDKPNAVCIKGIEFNGNGNVEHGIWSVTDGNGSDTFTKCQ